ncbi:MAG: lipid-A-disaccharide synthase, partial [Telluria sp.]
MASSADISVAVVAGEVSGDMLAGRLLAGLRAQLPNARFHGIGGPRMAEQGFVSDLPMDTLTVRGLFEVIPRYRDIKRIQNTLRDRLLAERPAVFIGADYPGFNLGLEMQLKAAGIPTVHFVSPQIWAWRGGRIKKIRKAVSHMLVIFPFEEEIYKMAGVPVTYIGHPLAEMIPLQPDQDQARRALGIDTDARVVTVMPGSRMGELKYLAEPFVGAVKLLAARDPGLRFVVPMVGELQREYFMQLVREAGLAEVKIDLVDGGSHGAIAAADAVLVASGT